MVRFIIIAISRRARTTIERLRVIENLPGNMELKIEAVLLSGQRLVNEALQAGLAKRSDANFKRRAFGVSRSILERPQANETRSAFNGSRHRH
jgi:hypothetical protein